MYAYLEFYHSFHSSRRLPFIEIPEMDWPRENMVTTRDSGFFTLNHASAFWLDYYISCYSLPSHNFYERTVGRLLPNHLHTCLTQQRSNGTNCKLRVNDCPNLRHFHISTETFKYETTNLIKEKVSRKKAISCADQEKLVKKLNINSNWLIPMIIVYIVWCQKKSPGGGHVTSKEITRNRYSYLLTRSS